MYERVLTYDEQDCTDYGFFYTLVGAIIRRRPTYADVTGQR